MKTSTYICLKIFFILLFFPCFLPAQQLEDTNSLMNMDAVSSRPSLGNDNAPVTLGGYLETNSYHRTEEGISEGLSFQARRLTLFLAASISERIKFLSEIEFEDGAREIEIEFAAMDVALHSLVNLRGGIVMNPIGAFNENHDGPKWEFVERPDVAVNLLAATLSSAGFGMYGKTHSGNWIFGYEAYLTNGLNSKIISNEKDRTFLPAAKDDSNRFIENTSGEAMITGKLAVKKRKIGELGISYMGGTYNKYEDDGEKIEDKAGFQAFAIDWNTTLSKTGTYIVGEAAWINVQIPKTYAQQYGNKQFGIFMDVVQPIYKTKILEWETATLNLAARLDYVSWNKGKLKKTNTQKGQKLVAFTPAISFRPTSKTVVRLNYRYEWETDLINNPPEKAATWYLGFSTYF